MHFVHELDEASLQSKTDIFSFKNKNAKRKQNDSLLLLHERKTFPTVV